MTIGDVTASLTRASVMLRVARRLEHVVERGGLEQQEARLVLRNEDRAHAAEGRPGARQRVGGEVDATSVHARDVQLDEELGHGATLRGCGHRRYPGNL